MYVGQHTVPSDEARWMVDPACAREEINGGGNTPLVDTLARNRAIILHTKNIGDNALLLFAKSMRTLIEGMRLVPNSQRLTCNTGNLAIYAGKYNAEKEVLSHYSKVMVQFIKQKQRPGNRNLEFGKFASSAERARLHKRAAYVIISTPQDLPGAQDTVGLNGDTVTLAALANVLQTIRHQTTMDMMEETGLFN